LFVECFQCGGFTGRSQARQTTDDSSRVEPVSAAAVDTVDDDDDDDDDDGDDPFDIPEESDDLTGLAVRTSPERKGGSVEKQTAEMELESMSSVERKEKPGCGRCDGSVDDQSTPTSRTGSGRRKVSMLCVPIVIIVNRQDLPCFLVFLPRDAMHKDIKRGICCHAVSVCASVCPSVNFVYSVETSKHSFKIFSPSGSHTVLVFQHQTLWQYLVGAPLSRASNAGGVGKNRDSRGMGSLTDGVRSTIDGRPCSTVCALTAQTATHQ